MTCYCCELRAVTDPCSCGPGYCVNCKRCEQHCTCRPGLRQIVYDDDGDPEADEPVIANSR